MFLHMIASHEGPHATPFLVKDLSVLLIHNKISELKCLFSMSNHSM